MIALVRSLLASSAALVLASPAAAQHFPSSDSLAALLRSRVDNGGVGMVLGVLEADGSTRIVHAGSAGLDVKPLGPKSLFEIGSITKVFTGILLADLVERKLVSLDDPVSKYLPAGLKMPSRNGREITLLDLATHRSSLTRMPTNMVPDGASPYGKYTIADLYAFLSGHELRRDIGSEYEYSNIAVALLGHVIERVAGAPYEQLVQERILRPLGMTTTSTVVSGALKEWMTVGHDEQGFVAPYRGWAELPAMGALRSNAEDLLRFVAANVNPPDSPLGRAMRLSHVPRNAVNANADIGLNWQIMKFGDRRIIAHGGATAGFRAFLAFDPDKRVGAVLLANYPVSSSAFVLHLINPSVPLAGAAIAERIEVDVPESILRRYVGEYELRPNFVIDITLDSGGLYARGTGQNKLPIFPESETRFFYKSVNAQLVFTRDSTGGVTGLMLEQGGRSQRAGRRSARDVPLAVASDADSLPGRNRAFPSRILGRDQPLRIVAPAGYELSQSSRYPVLYVLETVPALPHAGSVASSLAQNENAPPMIAVYVSGTPSAKERQQFAKFLSDELRPWMAREYRTAPFSVIVGPADVVATTTGFPASITYDCGRRTADCGPRAGRPARVAFRGQTHTLAEPTDAYIALRDGFARIFEGWQLPNAAELASKPAEAGWPAIEAHFARLSERFGYTIVPPEDLLDDAAGRLIRQRRYDDAVRALERNRDLHPGSAVTWNHVGDAYRAMCRFQEAKEQYTKAHELATAMSYSNVSNYAMELSRVTRELESGRVCVAPGAARPNVPVAEGVLRTYVGEYVFSPRLSVVITLEGDTLYAQPTGQEKTALGAMSDTNFFLSNNIQLTFTKDESGAVTGLTLHQGEGRDIPGRKAK